MYQTSEALAAALNQRHTIRVMGEGLSVTEPLLTTDREVFLVGYSTGSEELLLRAGGGDIISCTYTASCCGGDTIGIGCVCAACVKIVTAGVFHLLNQIITVEIGCDDQWVPLGTFTVTECKQSDDITTLTGYDAAYCATGDVYMPTVESGASVAAVIADLADQCGLKVGPLPAKAAATTVEGVLTGHTCREMLGYMAALLGKNAIVDRDGVLQLIWFADSGVSITGEDYYTGELSRDGSYLLAGITATKTVLEPVAEPEDEETASAETIEREITLTAGSGSGNGFSLTNPFITQEILDTIWEEIGGLTYSVGSCKVFGGLLLEPGDLVTLPPQNDSDAVLPVMSVQLELDGGCMATLSATGVSQPDSTVTWTGGVNGAVQRIEADVAQFKQLVIKDDQGETKIYGGKIDTVSLFAQDITATGTITGATLVGTDINATSGVLDDVRILDTFYMRTSGTPLDLSVMRVDLPSGFRGEAALLINPESDIGSIQLYGALAINDYSFDTGWEEATLSSSFQQYSASRPVQYRRTFQTVSIRGAVKPASTLDSSNQITIFTLPESYCPSQQVTVLCQGSVTNHWLLTINTTGEVNFSRYSNGTAYNTAVGTGVWLPFDVTFTID